MISDYHIHSHFSSDSDENPHNIINKAIDLSMTSICFTDHMDYDFPIDNDPTLTFKLDIPSYTKELISLREEYANKLTINIGMELGMQPHIAEENAKIVNSFPFDFIIASTHVVDHCDPYYPVFWQNRDINISLHKYFNDILTCINNFNNFDVYGHLDYIIRYIPDKGYVFPYTDYYDLISEILKKLIDMGKGIEVNSAGYRYGLSQPNPGIHILKRYKELGGEIITVGSDAHSAKYIGSNFHDIKTLLTECGFKYYTTFKDRLASFHQL